MSETEDQTLQRICEEVGNAMPGFAGWRGANPRPFDTFAKAVARRYAASVGAGVPDEVLELSRAATPGTWRADAYSPVTAYGDVACEVLCDAQSIATFAGGGELQPKLGLPMEKTGEHNARLAVAAVNYLRRLIAASTSP